MLVFTPTTAQRSEYVAAPHLPRLSLDASPEEIAARFDISALSRWRDAPDIDSGYHSPDLSEDEGDYEHESDSAPETPTTPQPPVVCDLDVPTMSTAVIVPRGDNVRTSDDDAEPRTATPTAPAQPAPYLGYDSKTSSDVINAYMDRVAAICRGATPFMAPTVLNSFWPVYSMHDFIVGRRVRAHGVKEIETLTQQWCKTRRTQGPCFMDKSRVIVLPVHDAENDHWMLLVAFPSANHCVALCSLEKNRAATAAGEYDVCSNSRVIHDNYKHVPSPALARAMRVLSRAVAFSRLVRALHETMMQSAPLTAESGAVQRLATAVAAADPLVFENARPFTYSFAHYGDAQCAWDCGVYVLEATRRLLLSDCRNAQLGELAMQALAYSRCCAPPQKDMLSALNDDQCSNPRDLSVAFVYLKETRRVQLTALVSAIVRRIDTDAIMRARTSLLSDMRKAANMRFSVSSIHPGYVPLLKRVDVYLEQLGPNASSLQTSSAMVAAFLVKAQRIAMQLSSQLGKRTVTDAELATREGAAAGDMIAAQILQSKKVAAQSSQLGKRKAADAELGDSNGADASANAKRQMCTETSLDAKDEARSADRQ